MYFQVRDTYYCKNGEEKTYISERKYKCTERWRALGGGTLNCNCKNRKMGCDVNG